MIVKKSNPKIRVAILTSGGDSPGMNTCIRAIVKKCVNLNIETYLVHGGYYGLVNNLIEKTTPIKTAKIINLGGTIIGSSRLPEFKKLAVRKTAALNLRKLGINNLVVIGGDGSFTGASLLSKLGINCIGIPGTIDNNLAYTDYTIGFDTALNTVVDALDNIRDTLSSHNRCLVVETMGANCGDLGIYGAICSGAEVVVTPELQIDTQEIVKQVNIAKNQHKNHCLVVVTERLFNIEDLAKIIQTQTGFETRSSRLGYIQRGGRPRAFDRILATKFGDYAVNLLLNNKTSRCIGQKDQKIIDVDIYHALSTVRSNQSQLLNIFKNTR